MRTRSRALVQGMRKHTRSHGVVKYAYNDHVRVCTIAMHKQSKSKAIMSSPTRLDLTLRIVCLHLRRHDGYVVSTRCHALLTGCERDVDVVLTRRVPLLLLPCQQHADQQSNRELQ